MPPELACGPEMGRWGDGLTGLDGAIRAQRNWSGAVAAWAATAGITEVEARSGARVDRPWSREYLLGVGCADVVGFYDGRTVSPQHAPGSIPAEAHIIET